ncbi:polysaccharide biosynthesis protein [Sulfurovum sp. XGS-02]|uniref:polysaccharide biosynthesis protein n=1 Tax=Sulfurovum sp. XGS-02 TaxID=2925411 RepID=UPI00206CB4DC|nr:nucleoside-diphosphate sugar epimerase/dehydratase [Sulfurovum sp. XGS-02]UPT77648.1 polysaccharide biosynthesis protein [Sulfurovum sp. XGS-02]
MKDFLRPTSLKRIGFFLIADFILSGLTLYLAYLLRFNFQIPEEFLDSFLLTYGVITGAKVFSLFIFKSYFIIWRFFSFYDAKNILMAHILSYMFFIIIYVLFKEYFSPFPRSVIVIDFFLSLIFIGGLRGVKRFISEGRRQYSMKPTLIIGANSKTNTIIQSALKEEIDYYPAAIISTKEDERMADAYINNVKVFDMAALEKVIEKKKVLAAILTEKLAQNELKQLVEQLNKAGITEIKQVKILGSEYEKLENLSIEDLLARHPKDLDLGMISSFVKGKSILITGAGGSIGSEIARQCQKFEASSLTLVDNSEYNLYQIGEQITNAQLKLLSVTDKESLEAVFKEAMPQIVIHAAAYKHVPICEENQEMAVVNNVLGSKNVIDTSIDNGVEKVVVISTDKAVRPTNVMGATKRVTELYANNVDAKGTEIVAVRFGNVLGSSGSVIPKFKQQIEEGGPVTVTHPEITRYFMLISEACQLVLQTAAIAKGGELFILDMGEPVKIADLARQMIRLYGREDEVEIAFTGLRPGEKLYEELLLDESEQKTKYSSIFISKPTPYDISKLSQDIERLLAAKDKVKALQGIVPEYTRNNQI